MSDSRAKVLLGTVFLSLAMSGAAYSGGFARGAADTDLLYEDGNFNMRSSVTFVSPRREFTKNPNPDLVGTTYMESYYVPSSAIKFNLTDNLRCVGTYVQNAGGSTKYDFPTSTGKILEEFTIYEAAATCGVSFDAGPGKLWVLGGGYSENLGYLRENSYAALGLGNGRLELDGRRFGYRIGAAYEIPEIALRGQVMYRSGTDYGAEGTATAPRGVLYAALKKQGVPDLYNPFAGGDPTAQTPLAAYGTGSLPQSVEVKFQTGIAPDWLAFGGIKWMDWSRFGRLDVRSSLGDFLLTSDEYYWRDGWTVTGGIGHKFNDMLSGIASLTWDRGVSTGYDLHGDSYTAALGISLKDKLGGELRSGVGFSYLSSAAETRHGLNPDVTDTGDQAVKAGYAIAVNLGYSVKW